MTRIAIRDSTDSYNIDFFDNTNGIKYHSADLEVYAQGSAFLDLKYYSKTQIVDVGMRLAFEFRGKDYWMTVTSVSRESEYEYQVEARSLSLEALREVRSSYKASRNMTFAEYLNVFDPEHSIRLNVNTISDRSRQLEWTGEDTILARILSLATKFDAEIAFETELNDDYSLKEFRLNAHALNELGKDRTGTPFRISNSQLKLIKFKSSIDEFYSAIRGTGKDGLTISGLDKKVYDDEGKLLFYTSGGTILAPQARDKFISITNKDTSDGYIVREFDNTQHETKEALYAYMLGELKKHCEPQIDYTIDGYIDADVNDTVLLIDDKYTTDDLMLTARVNKQKWSLIDKLQGNNRTELANYVRVYSEIADELITRMNELIEANKVFDVQILTSNGYSFKNGFGETTLTARVMDGPKDVTSEFDLTWFKNSTEYAHTASINVQAGSIDELATYLIIAEKDGRERGRNELTVFNVDDGSDGLGIKNITSKYGVSNSNTTPPATWVDTPPNITEENRYLWNYDIITYTDSTTSETSRRVIGVYGDRGLDGVAGKDGLGVKTTTIAYAISTSGTDTPSSGWSSQVPTLQKGKYLWTKTTWTYTDDSVENGYTVSYIARDGNNGNDGIAGKDGVGIESTLIQYAGSTSGTTHPTTGWSSSIPVVPNGQYLWTKTTWTYTDGTSETGYSVAKMGATGPRGEQGIQGPPGANGQSLYTWLKYADDANGNGMSETPDGKKYIGLAYNKTVATESTNPGDYTWSLIQGANGVKGADGITHYTWVKYADTATGGGLSDSPTGKKYIGLAYNKTTPTESTNPGDYQWALIKGDKGEPGETPVVHTAWADSADGRTGFSLEKPANRIPKYRGHYVDYSTVASTDPTRYEWERNPDDTGKVADEANEQSNLANQLANAAKELANQANADATEANRLIGLANTEISRLNTNVDNVRSNLTRAEQEFADSLETTTRELTAKISGIDVGGRNLLKDTANFGNSGMPSGSKDGWLNGYHDSAIESEKYNGLTVRSLKNVSTTKSMCDYYFTGFNLGDTYTLSFWARGTIDRFNCYFYGDSGYVRATAVAVSSGGELTGSDDGRVKFLSSSISSTEWRRLWVSWKIADSGDISIVKRVLIRTDGATSGDLYVCGMKLEKGNKATDWSPAPEDFQSDLSNTSIELTTRITESAASLRTEMSEKYSTKNDLTTLQGDYNSFKQQTAQGFSQQASSIQTIQTDTATARQMVNDALSRAQNAVANATNASDLANSALDRASNATNTANSASQNATNAVASANSAVSTANTAKNNADRAIADVAALTRTVSSQSTRIDQTSSRIDQVASGITEVGNRLDNLQVGGRNLLLKTGYFDTSKLSGVVGDSSKINLEKTIITDDSSPSGKAYRINKYKKGTENVYGGCYWVVQKKLVAGKEYTWSAYVRGVGTLRTFGPEQGGAKAVALTSTWTKVSHTFTANDSQIYQFTFYSSTDFDLYLTDLMLEEGNTPTDWSPAPEDTQTQIDGINNNLTNNYYQKTTVESKLSTAVSGITAQYTQDINTRLGNYYDKSTIDSKLTIDGQGISTYVKNTKSQLDNLQVGGRNLLHRTGYFDTSKLSGVVGDSSKINLEKTIITDDSSPSGKAYRINKSKKGTENIYGGCYWVVQKQLTSGKKYTWSIYVRGSGTISVGPEQGGIKSVALTSSWTKVNHTFTANSNQYYQFVFYSTNDFDLYLTDLMLEEGTTPSPWQPAPEDMATLTQYTEVKQLADRISSTVYDSSTGLTTKVNQLANSYAITALNSAGDILASLNLNANTSTAEINAKLIRLNGYTKMDDAFVNNLVANNIITNKIKATEISGDYIKGGTIDGTIVKSTGPNGTTELVDGWFISTQNNAVGHYGAQSVDMTIYDSGQYAGSTKLTYNGFINEMKNNNGAFAKRKITFHSEGFKIEPEDTNVGTNLNSGMHLVGKKAYLDFVANTIHRTDATPYYLRIIANEDGKAFIESTQGRLEIYTKNQEQLVVNSNYIPQTNMDNNTAIKQMVVVKPNESGSYMEIQNRAGKAWGISVWQSDQRLKDNITAPTKDALDTLNQLQVRQFDWKSDNVHEDFGLVAQEVEQILPNAVFKVGDYYQVKDSGLIPVLIGAVQKLSNKVNLLENIIYNTKGSNLI